MKQNEELLGTLRLREIDQPWFHFNFESTELFQEVEHLFVQKLELLNEENSKILNLCLIDIENGKKINKFILHIEDEARFRY